MNITVLEDWRDIKGYEGLYLVSNYGRVMSLYKKKKNGKGSYFLKTKILKQTYTTTGYKKVELTSGGKTKSHRVHRLVAINFLKNPQNKETVNHIDGNKTNNKIDNLEWATYRENSLHAIETNLKETFNVSKEDLKILYIDQNMSCKQIGQLYNVSETTIARFIEKHNLKKKIVTKYQINVEDLTSLLNEGYSNNAIAGKYGCDPSLISKYKTRIEREGKIYG